MFRYRCPKCSIVLQALEIRAGKTTVCAKCSHTLTIPADKSQWVNEKGDPLLTSPTMVLPSSGITPSPLLRTPDAEIEIPGEADNDVLGAISHGDIELPSLQVEAEATPEPKPAASFEPPAPSPSFSRSLPVSESDDGKVELYPTPPKPVEETPRPPITLATKHPTPPPRSVPRRPVPAALNPKVPTPPPRSPAVSPPPRLPVPTSPPTRRTEPAWEGASSQSGSRPQRTVDVSPVDADRAVGVEEPLRLRTNMDIAVDLTSALAMRMKPPPKPPRDLKPSTAAWILTTGIAVALFAATLLSSNNFTQTVFVIGAAQIIAGYAWVTMLAFRRDLQRGIACALPPITFYYLTNWKYAKYRPLRFVISGAAVLGLALLAPLAQSRTRSWVGVSDAPPEIAHQSKLIQLRYYRDQRQYDALIALLRTLARTDSMYSEESKNRIDIATDLRALCKHTDSGVKIEALAAYAAWGGPDARELCLEASRSPNREERLMALRLLPRWKDEDVARRIAEMIGRAGTETSAAQDALITLGGSVAERATIPLLRKDDQGIRLTAIEILGNEKVGGADAIAALKEVVRITPDPGTRLPAEAKIVQIQERLKK